jgi:hypothetical protein
LKSPRVGLLIVGAALALVALALLIWREGPDRTVVGVVTALERHRICVQPSDGPTSCADVDAPIEIEGIARGDCVRVRRSAEHSLVSVRKTQDCN